MLRTNTCGELTIKDSDQEVTLCGWVDRLRDLGQLFFITIRDRYGITQCVWEKDDEKDTEKAEKIAASLKDLSNESVIQLTGVVKKRTDKDINKNFPTGEIEVRIKSVELLNKAKELPFQVREEIKASPDMRLKYRYLDLRRQKMQRNLEIRHKVLQITRDALTQMNFLEIETPLLIRSTPEGARDFVVPSRMNPGKFYALPQSPQLYKQLLMISGCDRYFQFAPAFRDEDLRADRVPVHTQIDMEMTFVEEKDVFHAVESYVTKIFKEIKGLDIPAPFPIIPYKEAMERWGIDKPDLRFDLELNTITDIAKQADFAVFQNAESVRAIYLENGKDITRKKIDELTEVAKTYGAKGLAWTKVENNEFKGGVGKFIQSIFTPLQEKLNLAEGALVLFVADTYKVACTALGQVRLRLGTMLDLIDHNSFKFMWVNKFPLFEWNEEQQSYNAMHHLFTKPLDEDLEYLESDPSKVRGQLYDLVLNGVELLSGSIRINRPEMQKKVLEIVSMPEEEAQNKFGFLMDAFEYGAPPHGGSAMGLDRLVAILCGESSIREVIAYPCNHNGVHPLDGSPAPINPEQYEELQIKLNLSDKK